MDAYAEHLAQVNDVQDVLAADDIVNSQGQILVKKGAQINHVTAERIARFKLMKPLEDTIVIENELTASSLQECFAAYFSSDTSLAQLFKVHNDPVQLKQCTEYFSKFPLLRQKVTVLSLLMPTVFEQAMFCAWFSIALSKKILSSSAAHKELFIAALCHDIGIVHISGDILNKTGTLTLEEWKNIQSHPVIAYNILKETKGLNPSVARSVLEHHENLDGTGYPRGCVGAILSHEGQLLNLLDSVNAVFNKHFRPNGRSIREVLPIIQMNQHSRFGLAAKHLIMILKDLPTPPPRQISAELAAELIQNVQARNAYIAKCVDFCSDLANELGFRHESSSVNSLLNAIIHITMSIAQSGIINEAYMRWLQQVQQERLIHAYGEVEEAFLMMQEIIYHIEKLCRQLQASLEKGAEKSLTPTLKTCLNGLQNTVQPKLTAQLANAWNY